MLQSLNKDVFLQRRGKLEERKRGFEKGGNSSLGGRESGKTDVAEKRECADRLHETTNRGVFKKPRGKLCQRQEEKAKNRGGLIKGERRKKVEKVKKKIGRLVKKTSRTEKNRGASRRDSTENLRERGGKKKGGGKKENERSLEKWGQHTGKNIVR